MNTDGRIEELESELHRIKYVELARAYEDLRVVNDEKSKLVSKLRQQAEVLDRQTKEDCLTGLHNRRFLDDQLPQEISRARRFERDLTVVMADIDNFKRINDQFSHQVGDEVIRTVARILRESCRMIDIVARFGGEEFVLLLIETPVHKARMLCEKIRSAIELYEWSAIDPALHVTISMGLTDDLTEANSQAMLSDADASLYDAKRAGRNQIASR